MLLLLVVFTINPVISLIVGSNFSQCYFFTKASVFFAVFLAFCDRNKQVCLYQCFLYVLLFCSPASTFVNVFSASYIRLIGSWHIVTRGWSLTFSLVDWIVATSQWFLIKSTSHRIYSVVLYLRQLDFLKYITYYLYLGYQVRHVLSEQMHIFVRDLGQGAYIILSLGIPQDSLKQFEHRQICSAVHLSVWSSPRRNQTPKRNK